MNQPAKTLGSKKRFHATSFAACLVILAAVFLIGWKALWPEFGMGEAQAPDNVVFNGCGLLIVAGLVFLSAAITYLNPVKADWPSFLKDLRWSLPTTAISALFLIPVGGREADTNNILWAVMVVVASLLCANSSRKLPLAEPDGKVYPVVLNIALWCVCASVVIVAGLALAGA